MKEYEDLAKRNNWSFSFDERSGRPYFMKDEEYATPDENTSIEDKILLASIISEGSSEMEKLIVKCWDNGLKIVGPCSGIGKFHKEKPLALHFGFIGNEELLKELYTEIKNIFPNFSNLYRYNEKKNEARYDINYFLNEQELSEEEANEIFKIISEHFDLVLENRINSGIKL